MKTIILSLFSIALLFSNAYANSDEEEDQITENSPQDEESSSGNTENVDLGYLGQEIAETVMNNELFVDAVSNDGY